MLVQCSRQLMSVTLRMSSAGCRKTVWWPFLGRRGVEPNRQLSFSCLGPNKGDAHLILRQILAACLWIPFLKWSAKVVASLKIFFLGRRAFNLATNISGLPLASISEVERQSGCFSKKQCNSLLYRGPDHQPKVCTRYETNSLRATSAQEPLPPPVETGSDDVPVNELVPAVVALPGESSAAPQVTNPLHLRTSSNNNRKEELGAGPLRPDSTSGPSLVMPVAAGVITACVLFTWSHIRRRKSSR
ncbi:transmembrane protein, putative [Bodo saltans]|uniref:Transmembrane protein, putative n=1 Tax=Bodo saltans TaxID=75058 RepID=A0A0S4IN37_BODSA|nr:transmembrane protein, putative [Bodo saltans]|eukprot:CUF58821.1 transmembrane protein, putative [Bodo saltans]